MRALWVVGDVHGAYDKLQALLVQARLIDTAGHWTGGDAHLVFLGDYLDRGPDGIGVIRLIQALEREAPQQGGQVTALLGNHEVMFLAAVRFQRIDPTDRLGFYEYWSGNGGRSQDLQRLEGSDITWLSNRPAMVRVGDWLLLHADSLFYLQMGQTMEAINEQFRQLLSSTEPHDWGAFANAFVDRLNFAGRQGEAVAGRMLRQLGGKRLVHGHSPVHLLLAENEQQLDAPTTAPVAYSGGLCLDVDSGMAYFADAGFIVQLGQDQLEEVVSLPESYFWGVAGRPGV